MSQCLVVDDSAVIRKVAGKILKELNFDVVEAEDGQKALDQCETRMPEAVLLDWNMPVMDGLDYLVRLRRMPGGEKPIVIFCTTENDINHITKAIESGANEYIMKPFDKELIEMKFKEVGLI